MHKLACSEKFDFVRQIIYILRDISHIELFFLLCKTLLSQIYLDFFKSLCRAFVSEQLQIIRLHDQLCEFTTRFCATHVVRAAASRNLIVSSER